MKTLKIALRPETVMPILALTFASAACVVLVIARIVWSHNIRYVFLIWNLLLAWLPLLFALWARERDRQGAPRNWGFFGLAGAWLLFFPNAPYIFTDIVHLTGGFYRHFWVDLSLFLLCALTGLVLGFVSLYLMQSVVTERLGRVAGWLFILVVAGMAGFGIYLGRFLRFNSWDVLTRPVALSKSVGAWASHSLAHPNSLAFPVLFAAFLFTAYVMLYALTHLPKVQPPAVQQTTEAMELETI